jgi:hypothetical protein
LLPLLFLLSLGDVRHKDVVEPGNEEGELGKVIAAKAIQRRLSDDLGGGDTGRAVEPLDAGVGELPPRDPNPG